MHSGGKEMGSSEVILCTGGIGSGKSCIVRALSVMGVPAYDCDAAAKRLYEEDKDLLEEIVRAFGRDVLDAEGRLDRSAISARIFGNEQSLRKLESIVHPAVLRDFEKWKAVRTEDLVVMESAIALEKEMFRNVADCVIAVSADRETRLTRVMERDGCSREQAEARMTSQWPDSRREAEADYVLITDDRHAVLPALKDIIENERNGKN